MIDIDITKNLEYYTNYKISLNYLSNLNMNNYNYPQQTNFHIYTEVVNPVQLLVIKSYLATQNLEKTNLTVWSDYDISNNILLKPYLEYIKLKIYDPIKEGKNTPLEGMPHLTAKGIFHYVQADIFRLLILYKYGGIFADMDIIFLRNLKPILDQEYMYMWGIYTTNFEICATVVSLFKNSPLATILLEEATKIPVQEYGDKLWFCTYLFDLVYKKHPFRIFPSAFFNTEWQIPKYNFQPFKKLENINDLFLEAFTWHWHNGGGRRKELPEEGSKINILDKLITKQLYYKKILK